MGGACGTNDGRGESRTGSWWGNLKERGHEEDLGVDGDDIKMDLQEVICGHGLDWCS